MKALVVLAQPPLLEGSAPGRCSVGLLRGLLAHGVDVQAVAPMPAGGPDGAFEPGLPVRLATTASLSGRDDLIRRFRRPRGRLATGAFSELVRELARDADVVHLEETETSWLDEGVDVPSALHLHLRAQLDRRWGAPWRNEFRFLLEWVAAEQCAMRRHRHLIASSPRVADTIRRARPKADLVLAPLSLDPAHYAVAEPGDDAVAGMIGTGSWPLTQRAMARLSGRVWPLVRRLNPESRLVLAGRGVDRLPGLAAPGVEVIGDVPSGADFIRDLAVLVYPLDYGSGMKVKVLEAIASGVPVVTTATGAEGIAPCDGVIVVETDEEFAAATASILADPAERRERGAAARRLFLERYAPLPATEPLVDLYRRMIGT